jgi:exonuclease SbcD
LKLLHTADLHLGRQFYGQSLFDEQQSALDQIMDATLAHVPDVVIIAGDIYDRPAPPAAAVRQFSAFITRLHTETRAAIVIIAGNHDSGDRVAANAAFADPNRVLIRGPLTRDNPPLILDDVDGPVAISALPFANEFAARACFDDRTIASPADVLAAQVNAARPHVPNGARWIIVAHAFVTGADPSDSERRLIAGGVEEVSSDTFDGAHYVALGHLHKPQTAGGPHIRYSGSPMAFGFDESGAEKSLLIVDMDANGATEITHIPFTPLRGVRSITDTFATILENARLFPSNDFMRFELTDPMPVVDPMGQLRPFYPNAMSLTYLRDETPVTDIQSPTLSATTDPVVVITDFLTSLRDTPIDDRETKVITDTLAVLTQETDQ